MLTKQLGRGSKGILGVNHLTREPVDAPSCYCAFLQLSIDICSVEVQGIEQLAVKKACLALQYTACLFIRYTSTLQGWDPESPGTHKLAQGVGPLSDLLLSVTSFPTSHYIPSCLHPSEPPKRLRSLQGQAPLLHPFRTVPTYQPLNELINISDTIGGLASMMLDTL